MVLSTKKTIQNFYVATAKEYLDTATHCNTLQHTVPHCNTLQHTVPHCNTLQHTATHVATAQEYLGKMGWGKMEKKLGEEGKKGKKGGGTKEYLATHLGPTLPGPELYKYRWREICIDVYVCA